MPLRANIGLQIGGQYDRTPGAVEAPASILNAVFPVVYGDGTGLNQASVLYSATRTLASAANESLDLNGTALTDSFGASIALARIKAIIIQASAANTTNLTVANVTNSVTTLFGSTYSLVVQPGELLAKATPSAAGYVVTAATADLLNIANASGASATYNIVVLGSAS